MRESIDIDPLLREYLEQRRGLTGDEVDRLLVEWNHQGSLTDFLAGKALIDRTTAKMLITAQKGYLTSSPEEIRTVLGIRVMPRRVESKEAQSAQAAEAIAPSPLNAESPPEVTPPTLPSPAIAKVLLTKETEPKEPPLPLVRDTATPPPAEPPKPKRGAGRRGFLGASEEELRHILGARAVSPAATVKTATSGANAKSPAVETTTQAMNASSAPVASSAVEVAAPVPVSDPQIHAAMNSAPDLIPLKPSTSGGTPKVGTYLDRYYLEESLGEGATATIFRSFHKLLRIPVAIKAYNRESMKNDPLGTQRFLSEAQILIRLEHPNIVRVLDIAVRDSAPYIVFEYVGELSLQGMIQNMGHLPPLRIAQIGAQVAAALDVASSHGLLHRDVKPDKITFRREIPSEIPDIVAEWRGSALGWIVGGRLGIQNGASQDTISGSWTKGDSDCLDSLRCVAEATRHAKHAGKEPEHTHEARSPAVQQPTQSTTSPPSAVRSHPSLPPTVIGLLQRRQQPTPKPKTKRR